MGFDLYGLAPEGNETVPKAPKHQPGKCWEEKEAKAYWTACDDYDARNPGRYFRNNVWYWRPLWSYICNQCDGILSKKDKEAGGYNDDHKINADKAVLIANVLKDLDEKGQLDKDAISHEDWRNKLDKITCQVCEGTGIHKKVKGIDDHSLFKNGENTQKCNLCEGTGKVLPSSSHYPFTAENVREFERFARASGGFRIA